MQEKLDRRTINKPPLHKDFHKFIKKQHFNKVAPYSHSIENDSAPPPKNRSMDKFQSDIALVSSHNMTMEEEKLAEEQELTN